MHSETSHSKTQGGLILPYQFKPTLIPTIATLIFLPLLLYLGFWQLHRADEKRQILQALSIQLKEGPRDILALPKNKQHWQYLPVKAQGYYDNQYQFLVDNKTHKGRVGYDVITPMQIPHEKKLLLVNRGWILAPINRKNLPKLKSISSLQNIHGIIRLSLAKPFLLAKETAAITQWPRRVQGVDIQQMEKLLHKPVFPFILLLDPKVPHGFVRQWKYINMKPAKHLGYAVQWFALAATLFIIYMVLNIKRREKKNDE